MWCRLSQIKLQVTCSGAMSCMSCKSPVAAGAAPMLTEAGRRRPDLAGLRWKSCPATDRCVEIFGPPDCDLIAPGVSAIARVGAKSSQNAKLISACCAAVQQGRFPVVRGLARSHDDLVRRAVAITPLRQSPLDFESKEMIRMIKVRESFQAERDDLAGLSPLPARWRPSAWAARRRWARPYRRCCTWRRWRWRRPGCWPAACGWGRLPAACADSRAMTVAP